MQKVPAFSFALVLILSGCSESSSGDGGAGGTAGSGGSAGSGGDAGSGGVLGELENDFVTAAQAACMKYFACDDNVRESVEDCVSGQVASIVDAPNGRDSGCQRSWIDHNECVADLEGCDYYRLCQAIGDAVGFDCYDTLY